MRIAVAFDHRGVHLREAVLEALAGHDVIDFGTHTDAVRVDYPDKAREVGEAIQRGEAERAVLVCGSGVGAAVAAFLGASFDGGERYVARLDKVAAMERSMKHGNVTSA